MAKWMTGFMIENCMFIVTALSLFMSILQFKVAIASLSIQKETRNTVVKIDERQLSEKEIKHKVLEEIMEDMDNTGLSLKIVAILKKAYFRRVDMEMSPDLEDIFNKTKALLESMYENKK